MLLVDELVNGATKQGGALLVGAAQVWLTNIIVFALAYWELDRGGPVVRTRVAPVGAAAGRLPVPPGRGPRRDRRGGGAVGGEVRLDARRSSTTSTSRSTNSSAFSPTDTMPLSHRAKMLMATESVSALMLSVLVIARGVSLLK